MATISRLSVSLSANTKPLSRGLSKAKREIKAFTSRVVSIKGAIVGALGIGGIGAVLSGSLKAWRTQEQAVASLDATNRSMGRSTADLTNKMVSLAGQLQKEGVIGDEAIIQGMGFLSTYSQIPDELLPRATRAMVDLMAKTGESGQSAANKIGKAAMGMIGPLQIAGITLSDSTKQAAKAQKEIERMAEEGGIDLRGMTDNGKLFNMILKDIESQVGGTNVALGKTDSAAFDQLANSLGDVKEKIGEIVGSGIGKWIRQLSRDIDDSKINVDDLALSFRKWTTETIIGFAPLVQGFKGIQLVISSLKIAFYGFGALVLGTLRNAALAVKNFGDAFGFDIGKQAFNELDQLYNNQIQEIKNLKRESSDLVEQLANRSFEKELRLKLKEFDQRATQTQKNLLDPPVTKPSPQGRLDRLDVGPGVTDFTKIKVEELNTTNDWLSKIYRKQNVAVAG